MTFKLEYNTPNVPARSQCYASRRGIVTTDDPTCCEQGCEEMGVEIIDVRPKSSSMVESMRRFGYTLETALADIVDNSITARATGISVSFEWSGGRPWIAILDDGHGMDREELIQAMRFGSRSPLETRHGDDLGRYGLGMKTASLSQCRRMTVISLRNGNLIAAEWDMEEINASDSEAWPVRLLDRSAIEGDAFISRELLPGLLEKEFGTIVLWRNLDGPSFEVRSKNRENRFSRFMDQARKHIELVFHRFIEPESNHQPVMMDFNGSTLKALDPFGEESLAKLEYEEEIVTLEGEQISIKPYVLPHRQKSHSAAAYERLALGGSYKENQGCYVYRNRRLIVRGTWFRIAEKSELTKLVRVKIDIPNSLDHLFNIDVRKTQTSIPERVRGRLKEMLGEVVRKSKMVVTGAGKPKLPEKVVPVWKRHLVDGKIRYAVNEDHPMIKTILNSDDTPFERRLQLCFRMINESFPYNLCYADQANDKTEFAVPYADDAELRAVATELIAALKACGYKNGGIREQLLKTEPICTRPDLIDELLEE